MEALLPRYVDNPVEHARYVGVRNTFRNLRRYIRGRILDFGASYGLSMLALLELGFTDVDGVDIENERVEKGKRLLAEAGGNPSRIIHVPDTRRLPFAEGTFDSLIANAVLEHIPQPRGAYIRELWRVLKPGGHLLVAETPNKYLPYDRHTTHLWWIPWLPSRMARRYAIWRGRFRPDEPWQSSGWRGLGYYELVGALPGGYHVIPERTRPRHRVLSALGLPSSLLDPYPVFILRKD